MLSWPLLLLQFAVAFLFQGFGRMMRGLMWLHAGGLPHIYWPIVTARRIVRGEPRWQVQDCIKLGMQPKTDEDRTRADADARLVKLECVCGEPDCATSGMYVSRDNVYLQ